MYTARPQPWRLLVILAALACLATSRHHVQAAAQAAGPSSESARAARAERAKACFNGAFKALDMKSVITPGAQMEVDDRFAQAFALRVVDGVVDTLCEAFEPEGAIMKIVKDRMNGAAAGNGEAMNFGQDKQQAIRTGGKRLLEAESSSQEGEGESVAAAGSGHHRSLKSSLPTAVKSLKDVTCDPSPGFGFEGLCTAGSAPYDLLSENSELDAYTATIRGLGIWTEPDGVGYTNTDACAAQALSCDVLEIAIEAAEIACVAVTATTGTWLPVGTWQAGGWATCETAVIALKFGHSACGYITSQAAFADECISQARLTAAYENGVIAIHNQQAINKNLASSRTSVNDNIDSTRTRVTQAESAIQNTMTEAKNEITTLVKNEVNRALAALTELLCKSQDTLALIMKEQNYQRRLLLTPEGRRPGCALDTATVLEQLDYEEPVTCAGPARTGVDGLLGRQQSSVTCPRA